MSEVGTETSGPIEERESNNILRRSLKIASEYLKQQTRKDTITLTIPSEFVDGENRMPIDTAELRKQCEIYVKKRLEASFRMNKPDMGTRQKEGDGASSSTDVEDDGPLKQDTAGRRKLRRNDTELSTPSSSPSRKSSRPDPPALNNSDLSFREKCIQSRDRCIATFNSLSTRSMKTVDDLSARGFRIWQGLTRRQLMYIAAGLVLFIIINIVIGVTTSNGSQASGFGEPSNPPTFNLYSGSGEYLRATLDDMEPLNKDAFDWLKNMDSWEPPRDAANIHQLWIERYVLAAFYFSTSTPEIGWKSYQNWLSNESVCLWQGIRCNALGEVAEILLSHNEIVGSIPREIGQKLTSLERLKLDSNELTNGIPSEFGNLTNLKHLDLYYNMLSGTLPSEIGLLSSLTGLYLRGNVLTGSLPDTFGGLVSLTELQLADNKFRGEFGRHLGSLTNLVTLVLDRNRFSGSLPADLGKLTRLKWLRMDENEISGSIPLGIGYLTALRTVVLGNNMLTGTLPRVITGLTKLHQLDLRWNKLEGSIPPLFDQLSNLWYLNLSTNKFNGSVPTLPWSLTKQSYKNGPFCSVAGNYFLNTGSAETRGCKISGQREA